MQLNVSNQLIHAFSQNFLLLNCKRSAIFVLLAGFVGLVSFTAGLPLLVFTCRNCIELVQDILEMRLVCGWDLDKKTHTLLQGWMKLQFLSGDKRVNL